MSSTIPRLIASRATSAGVQWLTGNSLSGGFSQASATIAVSCSGENLPGAPGRGASDKAAKTNVIHKNQASRRIGNLNKKVDALARKKAETPDSKTESE